jgi:hypothetical protein
VLHVSFLRFGRLLTPLRRRQCGQGGMSAALPPVRIGLLADHTDALPVLQRMFEAEWPDCYGTHGPGDAAGDLAAYCGPSHKNLAALQLLSGARFVAGGLQPRCFPLACDNRARPKKIPAEAGIFHI